jgi:hypothetical protein
MPGIVATPVPERAGGDAGPAKVPVPDGAALAPGAPAVATASVAPGRARPGAPGSVRWELGFDRPVTGLAWIPDTGLAVSAGSALRIVNSRGVERWSLVAGEGHRVHLLDGHPVVWSPGFGRLAQLGRQGRVGWKRDWSGEIAEDPRGGLLLVEAATVAALGADGKDRWRVSLEGLRRLHGPFPCGEGVVFQGMRGVESAAVVISDRGMVLRETALERGSLLLGTDPACEPLIWRGGEVALLDRRGIERWRLPLPGEPLVRPVFGGFLLAVSGPDRAVSARVLGEDGRRSWSEELPVAGRLTRLDVLAEVAGRPTALGLCLDVSSPCARAGGSRGPYNALLTPGGDGRLRVLARHVQGHLAAVPHPAGGLVLAGASTADATEVALRGGDDIVRWQATLPGRLSAGPLAGPAGEIYVATCDGWDCDPPHRLFSITGEAPLPAAGDPGR